MQKSAIMVKKILKINMQKIKSALHSTLYSKMYIRKYIIQVNIEVLHVAYVI